MVHPVVLLMGYPAAGKSTVAREYEQQGYVVLNRDKIGGKVASLVALMKELIQDRKKILLDNTFPTAASRRPFMDAADIYGEPIVCVWLKSTIEQAQFNACTRLVRRFGHLPTPAEIKAANDPNVYPPVVLFKYRKEFETPRKSEGFTEIKVRNFAPKPDPSYNNGAIIFDFDGTLRKTKSGKNYFPTDPEDVELLPGRKEKLKKLRRKGVRLLGVSNQSGVAKGNVSDIVAKTCFHETVVQLGVDVDFAYCPHGVPPNCWCRKPMPGWGVHFIEKYKLDPAKVTMVGDMTSDRTFAKRCGFQYADAKEFFA